MSAPSPASRRAFSWPGALRLGRARSWLTLAFVLAVAGCLDLPSVYDRVFPAKVPGLRADQPWVSLPIGGWVVEGGIAADAISACFDAGCEPRAAVGLFRASGADAATLARLLDDPAALRRGLVERFARAPRPRGRRGPGLVEVATRQEGALSGFALRLARSDGSRPAAALVLALRRPAEIRMILIIAPDAASADRIARDVAPHLA